MAQHGEDFGHCTLTEDLDTFHRSSHKIIESFQLVIFLFYSWSNRIISFEYWMQTPAQPSLSLSWKYSIETLESSRIENVTWYSLRIQRKLFPHFPVNVCMTSIRLHTIENGFNLHRKLFGRLNAYLRLNALLLPWSHRIMLIWPPSFPHQIHFSANHFAAQNHVLTNWMFSGARMPWWSMH